MQNQRFADVVALLYDQDIYDWPGEIDFNVKFANTAKEKDQSVLEIACGTGRVALRLAQSGVHVVGMDLAADMLAVARQKTLDLTNVRWVKGDMRSFDLGERFGLVIIAVHSFQFMLTPQEQLECLQCVRRHLIPGGLLIIHIDNPDSSWLGEILPVMNPPFAAGKIFTHPQTKVRIRPLEKWIYTPCSQTVTLYRVWEEFGEGDSVVNRLEFEPMPMHIAFRFEMEHLLSRVGLHTLNVCGDFAGNSYSENSSDMIWLACEPAINKFISSVDQDNFK